MNKTTGQVISELGVRTVLAMNEVTENHLGEDERVEYLERIGFILDGQAGVGHRKIVQRSIERCAGARWN